MPGINESNVPAGLPWLESVLEPLYLPQLGPLSLVLLGLMSHLTGGVEYEKYVPSSFPLVYGC